MTGTISLCYYKLADLTSLYVLQSRSGILTWGKGAPTYSLAKLEGPPTYSLVKLKGPPT